MFATLSTSLASFRSSTRLAALLALVVCMPHPLPAAEVRLTTENDLLSDHHTPDDLYTFSLALETRPGLYSISLRENAFTDRSAGLRFDETYLSVARPLPIASGWRAAIEAGAVHVGHGLFGERAQNRVHHAIGSDEVDLRYTDSNLYGRLALAAQRPVALRPGLEIAPCVEFDSAPGFRSLGLAAVRAVWQPRAVVVVHAMLGARFAHASYDPLEPHLAGTASAAQLGVTVAERYYLSWSYNDHGERRGHLTVGYRLGGRGAGEGAGR